MIPKELKPKSLFNLVRLGKDDKKNINYDHS